MAVACAIVLLSGCYNEDDYVYNSAEILEHLTVTKPAKDSLPADGTSSMVITYSFDAETDPTLTSLLLVASSGTFKESNDDSLTINFSTLDLSKENLTKEVTLVSGTVVGECVVSAYILSYVNRDTFYFVEAPASSLSLSTSDFFIKNDALKTLSFDADLKSATGLASSGQAVFFESPSGQGFQNVVTTSTNGLSKAQFQYVFTDTAYTGDLVFEAKALDAVGDTIRAQRTVRVID